MTEMNAMISIEKYFDTKIAYLEKLSAQVATNLERRLEGMNEFRDQLKDQAAEFVTRKEINADIKRLESDIQMLREFKAAIDGKASVSAVYAAILLSVLTLLVEIALVIF